MVLTTLAVLLSVASGGPVPTGAGAVLPDQICFDSTFLPRDTVDTATVFACWARLKNYTDFCISGWAFLRFADSAQNRTYYAESSWFDVPPYGYDTAVFRSVQFRLLGAYSAWLWLPGGDTIRRRFWVAPAAGVEEGREPATSGQRPAATVMRGVLRMGDRGRATGDRAELLDATGRRLMALHAGVSDVSRLAPGVYFVRDAGRGAGDVGRVRKVVLQR